MNGPTLVTIKARLILPTNYANRHEGTITSSAGVVRHLLRSYATGVIIAKAEEEICNFK